MSPRVTRMSDSAARRGQAAAAAAPATNKAQAKAKAAIVAKRNSLQAPSPTRNANGNGRHYATRRNPGTARSPIFLDGDKTEDDEDDVEEVLATNEDRLYNARPTRSDRTTRSKASAVPSPARQPANEAAQTSTNGAQRRAPPQKKKEERKASVRKASYELDGSTSSDLSDLPAELEGDEADMSETLDDSESDGEDDDDADGASAVNLDEEGSDREMAARLLAAGDGESLLGSAASSSAGETDDEEERFIIEDMKRRREKGADRRRNSPQSTLSGPSQAQTGDDEAGRSEGSGSLSPQTLRQLGLGGLFDDEMYGSSSEPSFTDFFGSDTDEGMENEIEVHLEPRSDDDELTTDNGDESDAESGLSDISDLNEALLTAPFLNAANDTLAAGAGTQVGPGVDAPMQTDVPLLVIEDLDGRLIYARAQDGEAVFGSDGEFECVDDSDADDTDDEDMPVSWRGEGSAMRGLPSMQGGEHDATDSGDTTDELPNEDMPFPRLLVGSVAPHGGRSARRARALAARNRRLSPNVSRDCSRSSSVSALTTQDDPSARSVKGQAKTEDGGIRDVDLTISTEALARDPKGTLASAAKSLGISPDDVARMVAGIDDSATGGQILSPPSAKMLEPNATPRSRPLMGSFIPTSAKSVHRAVIDGSRQAPSPFVHRHGTQQKGLTARKRQPSLAVPSSKRARRDMKVDASASSLLSSATENASESGASAARASPSPVGIDGVGQDIEDEDLIMDLDDVMDASMMWRGNQPSSPTREEGTGDKTPRATGSNHDSTRAGAQAGKDKAGLNMNAVARWHRIPMAAFREGQLSSTSHAQPLGAYLFAKSRDNAARKRHDPINTEHSPFRGRGQSGEVHFGALPSTSTAGDSFMVSPVLWPTRSGASGSGTAPIATRNGATKPPGGKSRETSSSRKASSNGLAVTDGEDTRKTITKRQKRERKARRDIIKAALRESGLGDDSVAPSADASPSNGPSTSLDPPSSIMPRLSIVDPSPLGSPTDGRKASKRADASIPIDIPQTSHSAASGVPAPALLTSSPSFGMSMAGLSPALTAQQYSHGALGGQAGAQALSTSASSTTSSNQQPPSSVFGIPLSSPLFGGLLNPPNLGFRDDLDDREEDGILTI